MTNWPQGIKERHKRKVVWLSSDHDEGSQLIKNGNGAEKKTWRPGSGTYFGAQSRVTSTTQPWELFTLDHRRLHESTFDREEQRKRDAKS